MIGPNANSRPSILTPLHSFLRQRLTDGVHQTAVLHGEILARGYQGGLRVLRDWLATNRTRPTPATAVRVPPARRITVWIMRPGHRLTDDDRADLADARSRYPDLDTVTDLAAPVPPPGHRATPRCLDQPRPPRRIPRDPRLRRRL
ncbi:hypothetical protein AB0I90_15225 [Micromonospora wenchangensis]|uniref:hypothetical protein n=1 Tax=Micromonospora wenchangensis TaxID=1185415 RepID=UPI0033EEF020